MLLVTLHGFWGQGQDLSPIAHQLITQKIVDDWWAPDLLEQGPLGPHLSFSDWSKIFVEELKKRSPQKKVLALGYSMGGRLLLHALKAHPEFFHRAILVSSQIELKTEEEKRKRKLWEMNWHLAFQTKSWVELWNDWNHMEVLKSRGGMRPVPPEMPYSRDCLSRALKIWSPVQHLISTQDFCRCSIPLLWLAGEKDKKYSELYTGWGNQFMGNIQIVPESGHRVHFDQPQLFADVVTGFFDIKPVN